MIEKIDIHTHIIPKHMPNFAKKFGHGGFIELIHEEEKNKFESSHQASPHCCQKHMPTAKMVSDKGKLFREVKGNCWDLEIRIEECQRANVTKQVLSTIPVLFTYWAKPEVSREVTKFFNEHIAESVQKYPKNFLGLGTVSLQDPELATEELIYCMKDLGLSGVEIGTHIGKTNLNDKSLYNFYAEAEKLGASIFVHPWDMMGTDTMSEYFLPWLVAMPAENSRAICSMIFGGIFDKFPKLKVAFAHGGGSFPNTIGRIVQGHLARPDLCAKDNPNSPRNYLNRFYLDTLVHDPRQLQYLIDVFGANHLALGTDYPFPLGEDNPGELIESMNFDDTTKARLLSGTAKEWLGLEE